MNINIDTEFKSLLTPLSEAEYNQLEENIIKNGCREPLVTWNNTLLDGHNRHDICQKHSIPFKQEQIQLVDREDAKNWIDRNQLGRRNLTPDQMSIIRGRMYNRIKKRLGDHKGNQHTILESGQNVHLPKTDTTATKLAYEHGVDERTIRRDGELALAVEILPDIKDKIRNGEKIVKKNVIRDADKIRTGISDPPKKRACDKKYQDIPEEYRDIFTEAVVFDDCLGLLTELSSKIDSFKKKNPVLAWLPRDLFDGTLRRLRSLLREARPAAICPECNGLKCGHCNQNGFVNDSLNTEKEKDGNAETEVCNS